MFSFDNFTCLARDWAVVAKQCVFLFKSCGFSKNVHFLSGLGMVSELPRVSALDFQFCFKYMRFSLKLMRRFNVFLLAFSKNVHFLSGLGKSRNGLGIQCLNCRRLYDLLVNVHNSLKRYKTARKV